MNKSKPHPPSAFQSIRAIDYTVIFVRDMAAMRRFYEDILGFAVARELSPGWIEYRLGGNTGAGAAEPDSGGRADAQWQRLAPAGLQGVRNRSRSMRRGTGAARRRPAVSADRPR